MLSQLSYTPTGIYGGAKRDRTVDLLHAMQALSQLSYNPTLFTGGGIRDRTVDPLLAKQMLSQLSYTPNWIVFVMVELNGIEPLTSCMPCKRSPN